MTRLEQLRLAKKAALVRRRLIDKELDDLQNQIADELERLQQEPPDHAAYVGYYGGGTRVSARPPGIWLPWPIMAAPATKCENLFDAEP